MDRRKFLKWIPKLGGAAAVIAIPTIPPKVETIPPPDKILTLGLGGEQDCIEIATAAAICFGLKPRGLEPVSRPYQNNGSPNLVTARNIQNYYNSDEDLDKEG